MRNFNGRKVELLAPAGNFEIFREVVKTRCDAIYFGGRSLNMRMIRKGFNFSDEELITAIHLARELGKKTYITVNNLMDEADIETATTYLKFLDSAGPDGLIVQDFAVLELIRELNLNLEIHASVMMNVHNLKMVQALEDLGVTRVVLSRECTLEDVRDFSSNSTMEIEYFTHGDMCIAHGAQCYYSSMLFGMSSNRGKCLKPCRWWFNPKSEIAPSEANREFPMAVKDLSLYEHLPEMILSGVTSFKIEGRMREAGFITNLINYYADALDAFIADPIGYNRQAASQIIQETRKRDLSTGYAFGKPGLENINKRFEGTGKFYSTGRMFSTPTAEASASVEDRESIRLAFSDETIGLADDSSKSKASQSDFKVVVKVNSIEQARCAVSESVDEIILSGDQFKLYERFRLLDVKALKSSNRQIKLIVGTPRMTTSQQHELYYVWIELLKDVIDGVMVGNLGALKTFNSLGVDMIGDYSLNVFNHKAMQFYKREGLERLTPSVELDADAYKSLLKTCGGDSLNCLIYGRVTAMYYEHNFHKIYHQPETQILTLSNEAGDFDLLMDYNNRTHLLTDKRLNLIGIMPELIELGATSFRLDLTTEVPDDISEILKSVKAIMAHAKDYRLKQGSLSGYAKTARETDTLRQMIQPISDRDSYLALRHVRKGV